ncbi:uncharacterized protein LOC113522281 isoform X1 [Galleria mellonella]|uniref:Uncharacterized protein LOC113522281 isoform X1 n=1 Tax=Galleria mellonella TaxID=7137 RepID=A0A6J1X2X7_GALME|nr:uncharacterized protein LOC113522281 isoform X1 [Galleria mellonella]
MKKCSSIAWRFFDRIENEKKRCISVMCKLCDTQYKFFGNTTNLRQHLINKHPLQWELAQNGTFDESNFRIDDDESRSYDKNVRYSISVDNSRNPTGEQMPKIEIQRIDVLEASDVENDNRDNEESEATFNLVKQLHESSALRGSDEEWLEDDHYQTYQPKRKKVAYRKIKREIQTPPRRTRETYRPVKYEKSPVIADITSYRDEYSVFGEYVANKLRKFKVPRTRGNLQQLITTILWQAEYGTYDSANAVKRVLMYSVQDPEPGQSTIHQDQDPSMVQHVLETHVQAEEVVEEQQNTPN